MMQVLKTNARMDKRNEVKKNVSQSCMHSFGRSFAEMKERHQEPDRRGKEANRIRRKEGTPSNIYFML